MIHAKLNLGLESFMPVSDSGELQLCSLAKNVLCLLADEFVHLESQMVRLTERRHDAYRLILGNVFLDKAEELYGQSYHELPRINDDKDEKTERVSKVTAYSHVFTTMCRLTSVCCLLEGLLESGEKVMLAPHYRKVCGDALKALECWYLEYNHFRLCYGPRINRVF